MNSEFKAVCVHERFYENSKRFFEWHTFGPAMRSRRSDGQSKPARAVEAM